MELKVSENTVLYWKRGQLICDNFVAHEQHALTQDAEFVLRWFGKWRDMDSLYELALEGYSVPKLQALTQQLLDAEILIARGSDAHRTEDRLETWDEWRRSAKYFHYSNRTLSTTEFLPIDEDGQRLNDKAKVLSAPPIYKEYPDGLKVPLPTPDTASGGGSPALHDDSLLDLLLRRRTCRSYDPDKPVTLDQLSTVLLYTCGAVGLARAAGIGKVLMKTSPSGGSRHPIEAYPCVMNVEGVEPGVYHYSVKDHMLELVTRINLRDRMSEMCGDQAWTADASVVVFYTAVIERPMWKYPTPRLYRFIMTDLGHLSQSFYLLATWLNLNAFFVGALREQAVEAELGVDWTQEIVLGASGLGLATSEGYARERAERAFEPTTHFEQRLGHVG